jgi:hypothetical protein
LEKKKKEEKEEQKTKRDHASFFRAVWVFKLQG